VKTQQSNNREVVILSFILTRIRVSARPLVGIAGVRANCFSLGFISRTNYHWRVSLANASFFRILEGFGPAQGRWWVVAARVELPQCDLPNLWRPRPDQFFHIDAMPYLGTGKLDLRKAREIAAARSAEHG
jgi:hypothetical protein